MGRSRKWSAVFDPSGAFTSALGDDLTAAIAPAVWRYLPQSVAPVQKVSHQRGEIAQLTSRNRRNGEQDFRHGKSMGAIMTIAEYLAATALIVLIVWGVLGLLLQES
jgi:hypothetical protein